MITLVASALVLAGVVNVPDGGGLRFVPGRTGRIGQLCFTWSDGNRVTEDMTVDVQWSGMLTNNMADSVLRVGKDYSLYVRPFLRPFQNGREMVPAGWDLVKNWDRLEKASEHLYKFDVLQTPSGYVVWSEGSYVREIGYPRGTLPSGVYPSGLRAELAEGVRSWVEPNVRRADLRYEVLRLDENPRAKAFAKATLKAPAVGGDTAVRGVPMRIVAPSNSQDAAICRIAQRRFDHIYNRYQSRQPQDGYPMAIHYRLPAAHYVKAHLVFAFDPDPKKERKFVVRQAVHEPHEGTGSNSVLNRTVDCENGLPAGFERIGEAVLGGKTVPVYFGTVEMDIGKYIDFAAKGEYVEFELCGTDLDGKPESAANFFAVTLEKLPVVMDMVQSAPGNVFMTDEPSKKTAVSLKGLGAFRGSLAWRSKSLEGEVPVSVGAGETKTVEIDLGGEREVGLYDLAVVLKDGRGRTLLTHPARFCVTPPSGRLAERDPKAAPYGTWCFDVHGASGDYSIVCPLLQKAGIRKVGWLRLTPEVCEKYRLINTGNVRAFDWENPKNWDHKNHRFVDADGKTGEERFVEDLRRQIDAQVWTDHVLIWHEDAPAKRYLIPEEVLGLPVPAATESDRDAAAYLNACGRLIRKHFPGLRIQVGNTFASLGAAVLPLRGGADPDYYDSIAVEAASEVAPPERLIEWNNQILVMVREAAATAAKRPVPVTGCWEFIYRSNRKLGEDLQAAYYMRDIVISLMNGFGLISPAGLMDVRNGYYDTLWGSSKLVNRMPYLYPKKAYLAYSVLTKCLDAVTFVRRVPTGSTTVYAVEFARPDGKTVTALWCARGEARVRLGGSGVACSMYGRERAFGGLFRPSTLPIGAHPVYAVTDGPLESVEIVKRGFADDESFRADGAVAATLDSADLLSVEDVNAEACDNHRRLLPLLKPSPDFSVRTVEDDEEGTCVEVRLDTTRREVNKYFMECTRLKLHKPVEIPAGATHLGVRVKGNSSWGQIRFELEDARGAKYRLIDWGCHDGVDRTGRLCVNFDGWSSVVAPFGEGMGWRQFAGEKGPMKFPVKVTDIIVGMYRTKLDLTEFFPTEPTIRLKDVFWSRKPVLEAEKGSWPGDL